jgi:CBS domain-containing protein
LRGILDRRIEEIGLVNPLGDPIVSLPSTDRTVDGFLKMFKTEVNAVAVVDDQGKLIANLSASDLGGLSTKTIHTLSLPPLQFLELAHSRNFVELSLTSSSDKKPAVPVTCSPETHLTEVVEKLIGAKIHRVWVVDSAQRPIGVVTLTDILKSFVKQ